MVKLYGMPATSLTDSAEVCCNDASPVVCLLCYAHVCSAGMQVKPGCVG